MRWLGPTALARIARLWIVFGALGILVALASIAGQPGPRSTLAWHAWTIVVSATLVVGAVGTLRGSRWGWWIATSALTAALTEVVLLITNGLPGVPNPVLAGTFVFHVYGLALLLRRIVADGSAVGLHRRG
jgi:hypothetical protein